MNPVIVVGQSTADKCLIAQFSSTTELWTVDTTFPDIVGKLWGVYSYNQNDLWVCGGTGTNGITSPILYHYTGNGVWVDHSSDITDAKWLYSIAGNSPNSIYVGGVTSTDVGGIWKYTGTWTPTIINTDYALGVPNPGGQYPHVAVDDSGNAFTSCWTYISSNKNVSTWELFHETLNSQSVQIRHVGDGNLLVCNNVGGTYPPIRSYTSATGTWGFKGPSSYSSVVLGAKTFTHFCFYFAVDQKVYETIGAATTIISTANYLSNSNKYIYAEDDLWTCGSTYANGIWDLTAQLSHYESGTTWSSPTDYNSNGLGAKLWLDISENINPPPYLISGPVSPNPGYYIDTPMTWKLGQD